MRPSTVSTIRGLVAILAGASLPLCASGDAEDVGSRCAVGGTNTARALACARRLETPGYADQATQVIHPAENSRQGFEANVKSSENESSKDIQSKKQSTDGAANKAQNGVGRISESGKKHYSNKFQAAIRHIQQVQKSLAATEQLIKNLEHVRDAYMGSSDAAAIRVANQAANDISRLSSAKTNLEAELETTDRQAVEAKEAFDNMKKTSNAAAEKESELPSLKDAAALAQQAAGSGGGSGGGKGSTAGPAAGARTPSPATYSLLAAGSGSGSNYGSPANGENQRGTAGQGNGDDPFSPPGSSITAPIGGGVPSSGASVGNLKDKLQRELASRKSDPAASPAGSGGNAQPGAAAGTHAEGGSSPTEGADPAPASSGDLGLAVGLGDSDSFGDMLKGMLGAADGEQPLSEEERALLASRELASLGSDRFAPLPPEVLGAESESLFQRTRNRIETALKRGKVMNGLNSKL